MSPIRSSVAAGSSHALGDARFAKAVTEVTAQRKEQRWTTSITAPGTNVTLNQTPVAGNLLVIMVSSNNAVASPTITYGGTTATQITGNLTTGICGYLFYIALTSGNIASGGTTLNVIWSAGTAAAASITEVSGVYAASPVDQFATAIGSWNNQIGPSVTVGHTTIGAIGFMFTTMAGAQTSNGFFNASGASDWAGGAVWGNHTASCDVYGYSLTTPKGFTTTPTYGELLGSATARNGVAIGVSFRPAA